MSKEVIGIVVAAIAKVKKIEPDMVKLDSTFEELKMDSLDGLDVFFELEEAFDLTIPDARARNQWIISELSGRYSNAKIRILDLGCGAGFLSNELARNGYEITGLDVSESTLDVARNHDSTGTVDYRCGDAYKLECGNGAFDVVCAMDFLEHVENPEKVVREAARVLKPGGSFFFYTFNRNFFSWLVVIKGVEWFVHNTPPRMHRLRYFIKPAELGRMCRENGMEVALCRGLAPKVFQRAFWKMLATGTVDDRFTFNFTRHTIIGYIGLAVRCPAVF